MKTISLLSLILVSCSIFGQKNFSESDIETLKQAEKNLQVLGDSVVGARNWDMREQASIAMVKVLVKALQVPNSFDYPFDDVPTISIIYPDNRDFRIITWQMEMKDHSHRYYGTIQMNEPELVMHPLIDMSLFIVDPDHEVLDGDNWYGQIYYDVQEFKYKKESYYLVFGWDGNDKWSNRKMVDILWFDDGKPKFGKPVFALSEGELRNRITIEYKEDASPALVWDKDLEMIVFDYLRPENPMSEGIYMTYIPDGTYQGFTFDKKSKTWILDRVVFDTTMETAPLNKPKHEGVDPNIYIKN